MCWQSRTYASTAKVLSYLPSPSAVKSFVLLLSLLIIFSVLDRMVVGPRTSDGLVVFVMIGLLYVAYKNVEFLLNRDMATSNDVTIGIAAVAIVHHILHEVGTIPVMSFRLEMIDTNYIQALVSVFTATFTHATWSHLVANISVLMLCQRSLSANKWSSPLLLVILFFGGSLSGFALNVYCVMLHNWEMDRKTEQVRKIVGVCNNWFCNMIQWNRSLRPVIVNSMVKVGNWHDILTMMAYKSNDRVGASAGVYSIAAAHTVSSFAIIIMKIFSNLAGRSSESDASRDSDGNSNSNSNRNGKKPSSSSSSSSSGISTRTSGGDADGPPPSDVSSRGDKGATRYRGTRRYTIIDMIRPRKGTIVELVPYLKDNSWWFVIQLKTVLRFLFFVVKVLDIMNECSRAALGIKDIRDGMWREDYVDHTAHAGGALFGFTVAFFIASLGLFD